MIGMLAGVLLAGMLLPSGQYKDGVSTEQTTTHASECPACCRWFTPAGLKKHNSELLCPALRGQPALDLCEPAGTTGADLTRDSPALGTPLDPIWTAVPHDEGDASCVTPEEACTRRVEGLLCTHLSGEHC